MPKKETLNLSETPVTLALIVLIASLSLIAFKKKEILMKAILHPVSVRRDKEYYRLLSADLVHNDTMHLLVNIFALFAVGSQLEEYLRSDSSLGSLKFLFIYLTSCLSGTAFTTLRHYRDAEFFSTGASGSILGCMLGFMILRPYHIAFYLPGFGGVANIYTALIYILFLIVYQWRTNNPLMNNEVHFYGALGGIVSTFLIKL